jgi:catechol 2,3-dioxygenase-like lactoylglutathione lyase family enzyme
MLDHITLHVADFERSKRFFAAALVPLGYQIIMEFPGVAGLGVPGRPDFWIAAGDVTRSLHVAFVAADRTAVDAFHRAAIAAGGRDNGAPGLRPQYHPNYYGAFVFDLDGNNVEAVCHQPA